MSPSVLKNRLLLSISAGHFAVDVITARVHATNINRFTFSTTITITKRAA